jgi:xanthine dehydrogenase YagT iron-sulfur-binding subunit
MRTREVHLPQAQRTPSLKSSVPAIAEVGDVPIVVAFASGWSGDDVGDGHLEAIRAELRGLGAVLVVFSDTGIWSFRPDDEIERRSRDTTEEVERVAALYGVKRGEDGRLPLTVFVLDSEGVARFADTRARGDDVSAEEALLGALSSAGRSLLSRPAVPILLSRREIVVASLVAGFMLSFGFGCERPAKVSEAKDAAPAVAPADDEGQLEVVLRVNGEDRAVRIDPRVSLLDALRERLGLTGTKKGCDHGQCGACTVLVDGRRVCSCFTLAVVVASAGSKVTTIEGLAHGDELHPMQKAFASLDAFQCGYCTPGQILSAVALLEEGHAKTDDEVREGMSGNICRCGAYPNIVAAVQRVRAEG